MTNKKALAPRRGIRMPILLAAVFCAGASFADGDENVWWVDDDNYGKSGLDGTSAEKAFGTIQDAIDNSNCTDGDTINVLPGTYDQGSSTFGSRNYRVLVNKRLDIKATGSKDETHIVGRFCPVDEGGDETYGTGPTALSCVIVPKAGLGSSLTGFTLRNGASITETPSSGNIKNNGGAIAVNSDSDAVFVDCVISNSVSRARGGAAYRGTFIRCLVSDCRALRGAAFMGANVVNSVIAHCSTPSSDVTLSYTDCKFVNCTFYGNEAAQITGTSRNCLFLGNDSDETNGVNEPTNLYGSDGKAYRNTEPVQLFAPALGDFHPLPGSAVFGAGDTRYLTTDCPVTLPAGMEMQDMDGTPIDLTGEHVAVGAYQAAKTPQYGGIHLEKNYYVNGFPTYGTNRFFATSWPVTVSISNVVWLAAGGGRTGELDYRYSGKDNSLHVTPPYEAGVVELLNMTKPSATSAYRYRYVDSENGSDDNTGMSANDAYATIQKAVGDYTQSGRLFSIYVAEGDYNANGAVSRGVTNRVQITGSRYIKFIATGARERTVIRGAAATNERDPVNHPGCGPDAVRCVSFSYDKDHDFSCAFVGFTFADGHTDVGQNANYDMGGAAFGRTGKRSALQFIDCVFTNCYAPAAGIASQAYFTRCRFIDCGGATDGFRDSVVASSIIEDGNFGTGVIGSQTCAIGCSIAGSNAVAAGCEGQVVLNTAAGEGGSFPAASMTFGSTVRSCFADAANGDFRPVSGSPVLDATRREYPVQGGSGWDTFVACFSDFASCGYDGKPWIMSGGYPVAGACMQWVGGVSLVFDNPANFTVTGGKSGGNVLSPGDTLTISRSQSCSRNWNVVVNGVTNSLSKGSYTYAYDGAKDMNDGAVWSILLPTGLLMSFR